jgi:hypothetical protein
MRGSHFKNGLVVLMARVVDRNGLPVRTSDVQSVEYSILDLAFRGRNGNAAADPRRLVLSVGDVFCSSLQTGLLWRADEAGYNFRHSIRLKEHAVFLASTACWEARYRVVLRGGNRMVMRFRIKAFHK